MRDKQDCVILACCCLYVCEAGHVISGVVLCFFAVHLQVMEAIQ